MVPSLHCLFNQAHSLERIVHTVYKSRQHFSMDHQAAATAAAMDSTALVQMLTSSEADYLVRKDASQVKIAQELEGKVVGLLFAASRSRPCLDFVEHLKPVYEEINRNGKEFEIVYLSNDNTEKQFKDMVDRMPWLALPFQARNTENKVAKDLGIQVIPSLVLFDRDGKHLSDHGRSSVICYGAAAFPFSKDHLQTLKKRQEELAARLPQKCKSQSHTAHELELVYDAYKYNGMFVCHKCNKEGNGWSYFCPLCAYAMHPQCVDPSIDLSLKVEAKPVPVPEEPAPAAEDHGATITEAMVTNEAKKLAFGSVFSAAMVAIVSLCTYCCRKKDEGL